MGYKMHSGKQARNMDDKVVIARGRERTRIAMIELFDRLISLSSAVAVLFLATAAVYGLCNGGNFAPLSAVWSEVKDPLLGAIIFLARGIYDQHAQLEHNRQKED